MNSTNTRSPSRRPRPHFPRGAASALPMTPPPAGSWRYPAAPKTHWTFALAIVAAVSLHAAMFYGFEAKPARKVAAVAKPTESVIQMEMPPLPPEETEDKPTELVEEQTTTVAVPQLADVPSAVSLTEFSQLVDLRPKAEIDANALRSMTIPVNHGRGGNGLGNGGSIFKLSDLDRIPQAVAQPSPHVPQTPGLENGVVRVSFIVDAEGNVREPKVVDSTNYEFEKPALEGVKRWKFRPGIKGGRKVATLMEVPIRFQFDEPQG
ncbi:energy transducer TonB [Oleiharenicola sp. Vm1]|uniref:energy transducer TonB n=1 Tax=Oleiharenicola sp. Vm1 TaxID=3398393 RepID=UPI0039F47316